MTVAPVAAARDYLFTCCWVVFCVSFVGTLLMLKGVFG